MIDTYEKLNTSFARVDYIVHLADVHIRLTKRHEEYRDVFSKIYEEVKKTPVNRMGKPDELIGALIYLLSDASKFVNGTDIQVDGGFVAFGGV